jgi:hypothetical protein
LAVFLAALFAVAFDFFAFVFFAAISHPHSGVFNKRREGQAFAAFASIFWATTIRVEANALAKS